MQSFNDISGKPAPNIEEINNPVTSPYGKYKPMSFGSVGRGWEPRYKLAGTYDQNWIDNVFPSYPLIFRNLIIRLLHPISRLIIFKVVKM